MAPDDTELMLWALAHGWWVKVFAGHAHGSLWRDPARRRFLVHGEGPSAGLPALSDELRAHIAQTPVLDQVSEDDIRGWFRHCGYSNCAN